MNFKLSHLISVMVLLFFAIGDSFDVQAEHKYAGHIQGSLKNKEGHVENKYAILVTAEKNIMDKLEEGVFGPGTPNYYEVHFTLFDQESIVLKKEVIEIEVGGENSYIEWIFEADGSSNWVRFDFPRIDEEVKRSLDTTMLRHYFRTKASYRVWDWEKKKKLRHEDVVEVEKRVWLQGSRD